MFTIYNWAWGTLQVMIIDVGHHNGAPMDMIIIILLAWHRKSFKDIIDINDINDINDIHD